MLAHRVRLHEALKEKAQAQDGPGRPCRLHLSSPVIDVDPETATITLKDGSQVAGDVVVGADGVHSRARREVPGGEKASTFGSGKNGFRFMIQREHALNDPLTRPLCDKPGVFSVVLGIDRRLVIYPTSNNTLLNFLCIHPETESEGGDDWNTNTNHEALLHVYRDFAPEFRALLAKADPESLKVWKLLDMENLPSFVNSRLALIGDAAHPFLPHQGQGAAIAMEDAVALATVLEKGCNRNEVPERLELYNRIRYERACRVQQYTRLAGKDVEDSKLDSKSVLRDIPGVGRGLELTKLAIQYRMYNFGHDEFDNSAQKLREWKWSRMPKPVFDMPVAFGPILSTSSSRVENVVCTSRASFTTAAMKFRTSRTLMQTFLPFDSAHFSFDGPGTLATCSFAQTTFKGVGWLGGGSYNVFGLYVHGVTYTTSNDEKVRGTYVPVIFEDLPYSVIRDREAFGLPAMYSSITAEHHEDTYHVSIAANESMWANFDLKELNPIPPQAQATSDDENLTGSTGENGLLSWRSVPKWDLDDQTSNVQGRAVYVTCKAYDEPVNVQQIWEASKASVRFQSPLNMLPPLHEIVTRLSEIPIHKVLSAKVISGTGNPAFSKGQRIE